MRRSLYLLSWALALVGATIAAGAQSIFNCGGANAWSSATSLAGNGCGVSVNGGQSDWFIQNHPSSPLSGTSVNVAPAGAGHQSNNLNRQTVVNVQAFSSTFTFVPNGGNIAFVLQNSNNGGQDGQIFGAGAGGEGGFAQMAGGSNIAPNNVFALELDSYSPLTQTSGSYTYSSVQIYQSLQWPVLPQSPQSTYLATYSTTKLSTSPVPLSSPANSQNTSTGDTYSATITYDGYTLTLNMFDVTAGGSCPGASCFTQAFTGVYIPEIVGATTAYVGISAGTSGTPATPVDLLVKTISYTVNTPTGSPAYTAWNANSTYNIGTVSSASPVYSLAPGTYSATQNVAISTSTTPHNYICYVLSATVPALYPQPNNNGGCNTGNLYTAPISISSTGTLYAMAGSNDASFGLNVVNPSGLGPPSTLTAGTYTISAAAPAATPTFSPVAGSYTGSQTVAMATTAGGIICWNTTGAPATNGTTGCTTGTLYSGTVSVSSSQTLYAVAGGTGYTDSSVASAAYTITAGVQAAASGKLTFSGKGALK
jgi:hypothetical protein